jgi:hypothetical protein
LGEGKLDLDELKDAIQDLEPDLSEIIAGLNTGPMKNHFTVSRTGETGVLWGRFGAKKEFPLKGYME